MGASQHVVSAVLSAFSFAAGFTVALALAPIFAGLIFFKADASIPDQT